MPDVLFLQSDVADPYAVYRRMLDESPIYCDDSNQIWAVYSYQDCELILESASAVIPALPAPEPGLLSARVQTLRANLIRLSNPPFHELARPVAYELFAKMSKTDGGDWVQELLGPECNPRSFDWVETVAKKLPALSILHGFGFSEGDIDLILPLVQDLTKLMGPIRAPLLADSLNNAVATVYPVIKHHLAQRAAIVSILDHHGDEQFTRAELWELLVANAIGLLIQSYDAGRGLLSNALVQILQRKNENASYVTDLSHVQRLVVETLRFDPPVQNTKRLLVEDCKLDDGVIPAGATVILVMAAANRDPKQFERPNEFDPFRSNNNEHLTFGAGGHACFAKQYATQLTACVLISLLQHYPGIQLADEPIIFEPLINVRLPQKLLCCGLTR